MKKNYPQFLSAFFFFFCLIPKAKLILISSHKVKHYHFAILFFFTFLFYSQNFFSQSSPVTYTTTGLGTWVAPCGVTSVTVECWGAGGGGGSSNNGTANGGSGGGGGAYARGTHTVTSGSTYYFNIGSGGTGGPATSTVAPTAGSSSWFNATTVNAVPGSNTIGTLGTFGSGGVNNSAVAPTNGGLAAACLGNAATANGTNGSAGLANGGGAGGAGAAPGGGAGGAGSTTTDGSNGTTPGGGGGGGNDAAANKGGNGAGGQMIISWTVGPPTITLGANPIVVRGATSANLPYTATTNSPNQYSITWSTAALTAGFVNVPNTALPVSPIVLTVPGAAPTAVYSGTITVINTTTGCSSTGNAFSVTVSYPTLEPFPDQTFCATVYPTAYNTVSFSLLETAVTDFDASQTNQTIVLTLPAGFQFNTVAPGTITRNTAITQDITTTPLTFTMSATAITVSVSTAATQVNLDEINFNNFQIRANAAGSSGDLVRTGGTFKCNGSASIPSNVESFGHLATSTPSVYNSSSVLQYSTANIIRGCISTPNPILEFQVNITGGLCTPNDAITQFVFNTAGDVGSTNPVTDITKASLYYSDTTQGFSNAHFFGSVNNPNGAFTINGSQPLNLGAGPYYFYLTYTIPATATIGNSVDAAMTSFTFNGSVISSMTTPSPVGGRTIAAGTCPSSVDLPPPTVNTQTITAGSLIIPMDNTHQAIAPPFNLKAYGLVHALLQADIPVKWVIKSGKAKDAADFTANANQIYPTVLAAATQTFVASEFVVDSFWLTHSYYSGGQTATQVMTSFAVPNNVAVYKLNADVAVDVRYTLNHRPKIAVFSNGGFQAIQTTMLDAAGITNYFVQDAGDFTGLAECYTFCSESHWSYAANPDIRPVQRVMDFVSEGGNFLAQCAGIDLYENHQPGGGHFQTTGGVSFANTTQTNTDYNPDMAFTQYQGTVTAQGGTIASFWLPAGSVYKPEMFYGVSTPAVTNTVVTSGSHLADPDSVGSNVFYLGGHQYPAGTIGNDNGIRMYLNATLVPARRPTAFPISLPANPTICVGQSVTIGPVCASGANYSWSPITGLSDATVCQPIASPTATTVYTIIGFNGGCIMGPSTMTVNVNPVPVMTSTTSATACSGVAVSIPLTSSLASTYSWIAGDNPNTTGESLTTQTTATLSNTIVNNTSSVQTVIYTVTPTSTLGSCAGAPQTVTVTINPAPTMTSANTATICAGNTVSIPLTANIGGSTFTWIAADNVNTTGESLTSQGTATLSNTITNSTTSAQNVIYTVTPTGGGCLGTAQTVTVTVNPSPSATATPTSQNLCSGGSASIALTSDVGGTAFTWTVTQSGTSGGSNGSGSTISQTLSATGASAGTATYSITPTVGGCSGTPVTATITVNPIPSVTATPSSQSICSGNATAIALTSNVGGATFNWTVTQSGVSGASNSSGATITQTLTATGTSAGTATYTITPTAGGCPGASIVATVTVNPTPTATATPASQSICSNNASSIALSGGVTGTTYAWTVTQTNVSGASASSGTTIAQTLTATTSSAGTAIYTITPTAAGCSGSAITASVTVNPAPSVTATPTSQTICSGNASSIALTSSTGGATFAWTVAQAGVSGASASSGSSIAQTLSATGSSAGTAIYTITPTAGGCAGTAITATVTVNPIPSATATPASQSICSNNASSIALTSNVAGSTFAWTVTQTNVTGASASSGTTIAQTLTATTTSAGTAVYTITPTASTCGGAVITVTVTVNPNPVMTSASTATICSGGTVSIPLTSNVASNYTWIAANNVNTNGESTTLQSTATLSDVITNSTASVQTVVYTVTPTSTGGSCAGTAQTVSVTVNPTPAMTSASTATICSGATVSIPLTANPGSTFTWIAADNVNTNGESLTSQSTATISNAITNGTAVVQNVIYSVTPTSSGGSCAGTVQTVTVTVNPTPAMTSANTATICTGATVSIPLTSNVASTYTWIAANNPNTNGESITSQTTNTLSNTITNGTSSQEFVIYTVTLSSSAGACAGTPQTVTVTVNPVPTATATPSAQTICSGNATSIALTSNIAGTTYSWTTTQSGVSGASNSSGSTIAQTLTTTGLVPGTATYTITPTNGCSGSAIVATVSVNPTPVMTSAAAATICSGGTVSIALTSNVGSTFTWIAGNNVNTTGESLTTQSTATLTNSILNSSGGSQNVIYTVTPTSTLGSCVGTVQIVTVTVTNDPTPTMTSPNTATICSGSTVSIPFTSTVTSTYVWIAGDNANTTGESLTSQSTATLSNAIVNSTTVAQTVVYTVTPTSTTGGCVGASQTITVTINPTPVMTSAGSATICTGNTVSIPLTSNIGSTYTWIAADNVNTTGESLTSQSTATLSNTILNGTTSSQNVIYSVTPTSTGGSCAGAVQTVTVQVNPVPSATATPSSQAICSGVATAIALTSNIAGTTYSWTVSQSGASGASSSSGSTISQTLTATGVSPGTVTYTITPTNGCSGSTIIATVTVNPKPSMTSAGTGTICSGATISIPLTSNVASNYTWIAANNPNTTGESTTLQSTSTLSDAITNNVTTTQTVIYTVTPTSTGGSCAGTAQTVTVTVNPTPAMTSVSTATICSGAIVSIPLTSNVASNYTWIAANNVNTVGESLILQATATLSNTITNSSASPQDVIYTVTPTSTGGTCTGAVQTVTVTVNPTPAMTSASTATVCGGNAVSIPFTSNVASSYAWIATDNANTTGESTTLQSGSTLNDVITNTTVVVQTVIYTVTPTSIGGSCAGVAQTVTVTVNPAPAMTSASTATICTGNVVTINLTSTVAGATYTWIAADNTNTTGESLTTQSTATLSNTITNSTTSSQNVIYSVTPSFGTCAGGIQTVTVTVNPTPAMTSATTATICSGGTVSIPLTSNVASTYTWIAANNASTVGESLTTQATATLSNTITNSSTSPQDLIYTVTPTSSGGSCQGISQTVTVTVNPKPSMTSASTATICSGATVSIPLTSNVASNYTWIASNNASTTGESTSLQSTSTLSDAITNNVNTVQTVIYTVTPTSIGGSCAGTIQTVTVTVNPDPTVTATPGSQTICSGTATSVTLTSTFAGATFSWTVSQAGVSGASNSSGSNITQTLSTTGVVSGTAIYTITPSAGVCPGVATTITVTVNPTPTVTATPSSQLICSGNATSIALTSGVGGTTFSWTVSQTGVGGATTSSGSSIAQTLTTTAAAAGTATYTITPLAGTCGGNPIVATVTVNPTPTMTSANSATICTGATVSIPLTSNIASTYTWIATDNTNTTGESTTSQTTNTLSNTILNGTAGQEFVIYTVTPSASGGCPGTPQTVTVTVNPVPTATATPSSQSFCSGGVTATALTSNIPGTTYSWVMTQSGVTGASNGSGSSINHTLTTTGASTGTVTYTITPVNGCTGPTIVATVTVNPKPTVTSAGTATICSGATVNIPLTANVASNFTWIATDNINTTGESTTLQSTSTLSDAITNNVNTVQTVIYTVTPTSTAGGCAGTVKTVTVTVNPDPSVTATPTSQTVCSGTATSVTLTSTFAGATFSWTVSQAGVSGASNSSGSNITQTLTATGSSAGTAIYTITPSAGVCPGIVTTVTITVDPTPSATATPSTQTICGGDATSIALTSNVAGTTFSWTVSQTGVSGATSSTGSSIAETLTTTAASAGTATYTITPLAGTCGGASIVATVTVNPTPTMTSANSATICTGATVSIPLTSNIASTYTWIATDNTNTTGESITSQTTNTLSNTIINGTANQEFVIYTVTPSSSGGCPGTAQTVTVIVNPVPTASATPSSQSFCSGGVNSIALTSNIPGTTYSWTMTQSGVTGASNGAGSSITETLTTTGASAGTVTYTITPVNGCAGSAIIATVTVNPTPAAPIAGSNSPVCVGSTLNLTASNTGTTYNWSGPNSYTASTQNTSISNVTNAEAGVYTVTATTAGCTSPTATVNVIIGTPPTVNAGSGQAVCGNNAAVVLSGTSSTGTAQWTTSGSGTFTPNNTALTNTYTPSNGDISTGLVTFTLTSTGNSGCAAATAQITLTITPSPTVSAGLSQTVCANNADVSLNGAFSVASGISWSTSGSGTFTPDNITANATYSPSGADVTAGTATLTIITTGNAGCLAVTNSMVVTITPSPTVNAGSDIFVCKNNANAVLSGASSTGTGQWSSSGTGTFTPNNTTLNATYVPSTADTSSGSVILTLTSSTNGNCIAVTKTITVTYTAPPTVIAGANQTVCSNNASITLGGTSSTGSGAWTTSGSGTFTPNNNTLNASYAPSTADATAGIVTFTLTTTNNGGCVPVKDVLTLTITPGPTVNADVNQTVCANNPNVTLNGAFTIASGAAWTSSGTGTFSPDNITMNATYIPSSADTAAGSVSIILTTTGNGTCNASTDTMLLTISNAPNVSAGANANVCLGSPNYVLNGSSSTGSGTWTTLGSGSFTPSNSALNATYVPSTADTSAGTVTLVLSSANNGGCNAVNDTVVIVYTNIPTVIAGANQTICANTTTVALSGSTSTGTGSWASSGTGTFTPNNTTLNGTYLPSAADTAAGSVTLTLTTSGGCVAASQSITVTITDAPGVNAGSNQSVCSTNSNVNLNGTISGGASGGVWTTSGSGTFAPDNLTLNAVYTASSADTAAGSVNLIFTSSGTCNAVADTMKITYTKPPVVSAGTDASICANNSTVLAGSVINGSGNGIWTTPNGNGTFAPSATTLSASYNSVTADAAVGSVLLILTSTNNGGCAAASDTVVISINPGPIVNAGSNQSICANNLSVNLNGTVSFSTGGQWTTSGTGTFTPNDTTLNATYTPSGTDVIADSVKLILTSTGNGLCQSVTDTMTILFTPAPIVNAGTDITICNTSTTALLNGSVGGGSSTANWSTLGSGLFTPNDSALNATYNLSTADSAAGSVSLVLTSSNNGNCLAVTDTVKINLNAPSVVFAGNDTTICGNAGALQLNGTISGSITGHWSTSGNGAFAPNDSTLNGTYTPGSVDLSVGSATITLTANANGQCAGTKDSLTITFIPFATVNAGTNIPVCGGVMTAVLNGSVSGSTTTGQWSTLGSGTFSPNDSTLNATYNLSNADTAAGSVTLILTSTHGGSCAASTDTVLILMNSVALTSAGSDTSICSSVASVQLNGSVTGGSGAGQWTSSGTGTFTPNDSTLNATYTLSGSDITGGTVTLTLSSISNGNCPQSIDSMKITIAPGPIANAGSNIILCNTMSASLNGTVSGSSTTGQWTTLGTGTFAPNDSTLNGTYNLSSADSLAGSVTLVLTSTHNGSCSSTSDTVLISLNSNAFTSAGNDTSVCESVASVQLNGNVSGGTVTGQWSTLGNGTFAPNDSTLNATYQPGATDLTTGSVTLVLSSTHNCVNTTDTMRITFDSASVANAGGDQTVCASGSINLSGTINTTVGHWSTAGTGTFTPNDSTLNATYTPSVSDNDTLLFILTTSANSTCGSASDTVIFIRGGQPNASFFANSACLGGITNFADSSNGAAISSWFWSFGNGDTSTVQNPSYTYTVNGTYSVSLIVSAGTGCADTIVKTVNVNPMPSASFSFTANCLNDSVKFTDNSSVTPGNITGWNWTFGDGNSSTSQNPHHLYDSIANYTVTLSVVSDSGCSSTSTQTVNINQSPVAGFGAITSCGSLVNFKDTSTVLAPDSIASYSWTFGDGGTSVNQNPAYTYTTSATYTVFLQVQTDKGCTDTATKVITTGAAVTAAYIPAGGTYNANEEINFTNQSLGATTYTWTFGDSNSSTAQDPSHSFSTPGTYSVVLIAANAQGCSDTVDYQFTINPVGYTIPTGFSPNGDGLNDNFYIMGGPFSQYELRVFNEWGNQVFMSNSQNDKWDGSFNGYVQPSGTFMYIFNGKLTDGKAIKLQGEINIIR